MRMACITSSGSKPAITTGRWYSSAKYSYGRLPITALTCDGPMKPSTRTCPHSRTSGESRMLWIAAGVTHVIAIDAEISQVQPLRLADDVRGRGRRGLEADGEEHHLPVRMGRCDLQRLGGRIHHAHVGALRPRLEQAAPARRRHAQHVAVADERDVGPARQFDGRVEPRHRQHAHRAARAVNQAHVLGQQILHPVAENRMRVAAAELHQVIFAPRVDLRGKQRRQARRGGAFTKAADVAHRRARRDEPRSHRTRPGSFPPPPRRGGRWRSRHGR